MRFERGELFIIVLLTAVAAACAGLVVVKQAHVDYPAFASAIFVDALFLAIGQFYRLVRVDAKIASIATIVALLMISGNLLKMLTFLLLPYQFPATDQALAAIDAHFGFVWANYVVFMAGFPAFSALLKMVYLSCGWQIAVIVIALCIAGKTADAVKFMLAIIIGGVITIEVWTLFPSSTPAAFQNIPPNIAASLGLVVSPGQGEWLVQLSREGLKTLAPEYFVGVVGFPSYHTVLAVVSVVYAFKMRFIWLPFLALNTLMLPAILLHGSHNLVDVFGGLAVSAVSVWIAGKIADAKPASADLRPNAVIQA